MASSSFHKVALELEPDLHPLYPTCSQVADLLSPNAGLSPLQKSTFISHCLKRACLFADLPLLQFLLHDHQASAYADLNLQDEDGLVLASTIIQCFGTESEQDVEREECVRLLIAEGADVRIADKAGWTPLHHAALVAPPTLLSHLITHGCSPLAMTHRGLTALDIISAYSVIPGREDVAVFLEESMRCEGWEGSKMTQRRRSVDRKSQQRAKQRSLRDGVSKVLDLSHQWWGGVGPQELPDCDDSEEEGDECPEDIYTPPPRYDTMLVFSPSSLPRILDSLIIDFQPSFRNTEPASALYMMARFACLACDHTWLEELIIGATDAVEETVFGHPDDLTSLVFWLHNTTVWLHLMRCDAVINATCEILGSFVLIEEVINSVFVFLIRFAERRIDKLLDAAVLDHSPFPSEFDTVQFESDWSFFRSPFSSKKKSAPPQSVTPSSTAMSLRSVGPPSPAIPGMPSRPTSPALGGRPSTPKGLSSLRQSMARGMGPSPSTPLQNLFSENPQQGRHLEDMIKFFTALQILLTDSGINPAFITQYWSQVMFWTSCEIFNRMLTRKNYLCRSKAVQIGMNLGVLEEWISSTALPQGVESHFAPVREMLHWLQCLSSMDDFANLVATIQTMKHLNPLQMRRAVRDYRYEVNESRMSDDCSQYLAQLQKDWERQRVKLGVAAIRKEIGDRGRNDDGSGSSTDDRSGLDHSVSMSSMETSAAQQSIDLLFDRNRSLSQWTPSQPPEVLGELMDSRYMLPLLFPSDPRMLSALPGNAPEKEDNRLKENYKRGSLQLTADGRSASRSSVRSRGAMAWRPRSRALRQVRLEILQWVDGARAIRRWDDRADIDDESDDKESLGEDKSHESGSGPHRTNGVSHSTPLTRKPSSRSRTGRTSSGGEAMSPINPGDLT